MSYEGGIETSHSAVRERCITLVDKLPFPSGDDENWKHTDLCRYLNTEGYLGGKGSVISGYATEVLYRGSDEERDREKADTDSLGEKFVKILIRENGDVEVVGERQRVDVKSLDSVDIEEINWALGERIVRYSPDALLRSFYGVGIYVKIKSNPAGEGVLKVDVTNKFRGGDRESFVWLVCEVESGSRVILGESVEWEGREGNLFSETDIFLHEGTSLDYINYSYINYKGYKGREVGFSRHRKVVIMEDNSRLNLSSFAGGKAYFRGETEILIDGRNSEALMREAFISPPGSRRDIVTLQYHQLGFSRSNLLVSGAIGDNSRGDFTGTIRVNRNAQRTDAYQRSRMMLLSETAHAGSVPKLEILADDVKCSHGASVGEIDEDTLFYLMSRGIDKKRAKAMALEGFFGDFVDRLPDIPLKGKIENAIQRDLKELVKL